MEDLLDRVIFFAFGAGVGFVLGYIVARLREIKTELDEVLYIEKQKPDAPKVVRDEKGEVKRPSMTSVGLVLVVVITVWAAFQTGKVNGELDNTITCSTQYNTHLGRALRTRDAAIRAGTQSEIDLWTKYAELYAIAKSNPKRIPALQDALNRAIRSHRENLIELQNTRESHPYPDPDILQNCKEN
jgi:hypothetical protein